MAMKNLNTVPAPLNSYSGTVQKEWIDYNDHMNVSYYLLIFDKYGSDKLNDIFKNQEIDKKLLLIPNLN